MNLNEKPEIFGFAIVDFYILLVTEAIIFFIGFGLLKFGFLVAGSFVVITGGLTFSFLAFKKLLPEYFFRNLLEYLIKPKIYLTKTELNLNNPLLLGQLTDKEKQEIKNAKN